jgi:hypothetical protein
MYFGPHFLIIHLNNTHSHSFKTLNENCEFFNDCNAADNCSSAVMRDSIITAQRTTTSINAIIITSTIDSAMLTITEVNTVTTTAFNNLARAQTIIEDGAITTAVIIISEHELQKHPDCEGN